MTTNVTLGTYTNPKGHDPEFHLSRADRRHSCYTLGRTGMGKSTLLLNTILQDIEHGDGVCLIDPHGQLARMTLDRIPEHRLEDVVYFNPADTKYPAGLNPLGLTTSENRHLVVSGVLSVFKHLYYDYWGPRLEHIFRNILLTATEAGPATLLTVYRLLNDVPFRERVVARIDDRILSTFWEVEFAGYSDRFRAEVIAPVQNKVDAFVTTPLLRNILGQLIPTIDVSDVMEQGKILIANLSIGELGEDNANLLGSLLISQMQLAAMRRSRIPEEMRRDFFCFVDEFQNFGTDTFASILSEARKHRLSMFLSHQYLDQIPKELRAAVFGNVGTLVVFGVGARDASVLEKELPLPARNLVELGKHHVWVRLLQDGETLTPFLGKTLPPERHAPTGHRKELVHRSRRHYAKTRTSVEHRINRWLGV